MAFTNTFPSILATCELVAKNPNIEIITNAQVARIEGKVFVNAIVYKDRVSGEEKKLNVAGVFVEIGYSPASSFLNGLVELTEKQEVIFNPEKLETKNP